MKKQVFTALLAVAFIAVAAPSMANRYQRSQNDNPFRLIGYAAHAVGMVAEYAVMRPIHWVVSQPHLDVVFGHKVHHADEGTFFEWTHGDFSPSIANEMSEKAPAQEQASAAKAPAPSVVENASRAGAPQRVPAPTTVAKKSEPAAPQQSEVLAE